MYYSVMTSTGFQMRGSEAAVYTSIEQAQQHMAPGDQLVPLDIREHGHWRHTAVPINKEKR